MEGPIYQTDLAVPGRRARPHNTFYATTSFNSDIPLSYYSSEDFNIQAPAVDFDAVIKGASFVAGNCDSRNNRELVVKTLVNSTHHIRVDSLGTCLHNAEPPNGLDMKNKTALMQQYLFHLGEYLKNERTTYLKHLFL
jgi:hypothetical protein